LFSDILLSHAKASKFVIKAFEEGDLTYWIVDGILWATKGGREFYRAITTNLVDFTADDFELEALVMQQLTEVCHSQLFEERMRWVLSLATKSLRDVSLCYMIRQWERAVVHKSLK
jgi:hypothetical protein